MLVIDKLVSEGVIGDKEACNHNEAHLAKLSQLASQGIKNNILYNFNDKLGLSGNR